MIDFGQGVRSVSFAPAGGQADDVAVEVLDRQGLLARLSPSWLARPERLGFHLLLLTAGRAGVHEVDLQRRELPPGSVLVLAAGQVHRFVPSCAFDATLVLLPTSTAALTRMASLAPPGALPSVLRTDRRDRTALEQLVGQLRDEPAVPAARNVVLATVEAVLARLERLSREQRQLTVQGGRFAEFAVLVDRNHAEHRDVAWYAGQLCCTPQTLTRLCQGAAGTGAKQWIDRRVALEAQRLLAGTDRSVESIARTLGFSEPTNFVRHFRRHLGRTPAEFRLAHRR